MKKIIILILLFLLYFGLTYSSIPLMSDPISLTLLSLGLVLIAAFSFAEIGNNIGFPMVTGFILAGIFIGPEISNILSNDVVSRLKMFNNLAIGIIAISAGLEFEIKNLFQDYKSLSWTIFLKILFLFLIVSPVFYFSEGYLGLLGISGKELIVFSLLFFSFGLGTSPAIVLAVLNETKAKGRISSLVLNNAILKDLVVVILLAIVVAISKGILSEGQGTSGFDLSIFKTVFHEIGMSLAVGLIVGLILFLYVKYIHFEIFLFLIVLIIGTAEISTYLHLEMLLVFIAAGALIRNTTEYGDELHHLLEKVALPVFVVFFTIAGASIQIKESIVILPIAGAIFLSRLVAIYLSSKISSRITNEEKAVETYVWLGYVPQAGVTLGLIDLVSRNFPDLSSKITLLGMAVVALNLLFGPVLFKFALKKGGEISNTDTEDETSEDSHELIADNLSDIPVFDSSYFSSLIPSKSIGRKLEEEIGGSEIIKCIDELDQELFSKIYTTYEFRLNWFLEQLKNSKLESVDCQTHIGKNIQNLVNLWNYYQIEEYKGLLKFLERKLQTIERNVMCNFSRSHLKKLIATSDLSFKKKLRLRALLFTQKSNDIELNYSFASRAKIFYSVEVYDGVLEYHNYLQGMFFNFVEKFSEIESNLEEVCTDFSELKNKLLVDLSQLIKGKLDICQQSMCREIFYVFSNISSITLSKVYSQLAPYKLNSVKAPAAWARCIESHSDYLCFKQNQEYIRDTLIDGLHHHINSVFEEQRARIKDSSVIVFKSIDQIVKEMGKNDRLSFESINTIKTNLDALDSKELDSYQSKINPFELEAIISDLVKDIENKLIRTKWSFIKSKKGDEFTSAEDIIINEFNYIQSFKNFSLIELMPEFEHQIENVSVSFETSQVDFVETVGQITAFISQSEENYEHGKLNILKTAKDEFAKNLKALDIAIETSLRENSLAVQKVFKHLDDFFQGKRSAQVQAKSLKVFSRGVFVRTFDAFSDKTSRLFNVFVPFFKKLFMNFFGGDFAEKRTAQHSMNILIKKLADICKEISNESKLFSGQSNYYHECFSLDPIKSEKFMRANVDVYQKILDFEKSWQDGHDTLSSILIAGAPGSGKTSLLNILQLNLTSIKVYRLEDYYDAKVRGLEFSLRSMLKSNTSHDRDIVVLVDNIDQWFIKQEGFIHRDFGKLLKSFNNGRNRIFWIFTISTQNLDNVNLLYKLEMVVNRTYFLNPLSKKNIFDVIANRYSLSGHNLNIPPSLFGMWRDDEDKYIYSKCEKLRTYSKGNLRASIFSWLKATKDINNQSINMKEVESDFFVPLQVFQLLPESVYVILRYLLFYGESSVYELERNLKLDRYTIEYGLNYLVNLNIVYFTSGARMKVEVFPLVRSMLYRFFEPPSSRIEEV